MSYQVLARKWRPSTFEEMVGQAHVLRALVNALDQQRLHHAYLFTGTRGVGKTTIARLLAKSLNCETGVSSKPCGKCSACVEIAEGRFVDLIEVDAASRTKVEDTRELLENVQYAPTRGRYKVYLIDEVHMLSTSSFNALLKTLEEPPPHVKFLLATTDPQKLPVTVLSRCLQFNLKNMSREHIVQHLQHILGVEQVGFDEASLWAISEGAQGSMRDALSLTDQAIAFGQGTLREHEVAAMLGTVDLKRVINLVHALLEKNIDRLMALVAELDEHAPDYQTLMTEMMSTLHRVAIGQAAPAAINNHKGDQQAILQLAGASHAEDVHLYYQIAGKAKQELSFAPSERAGFEMALLRMLAFSQTPAANIGELPELKADEAAAPSGDTSPKPTTFESTATESPAAQPVSEPEPVQTMTAETTTSVETESNSKQAAPPEALVETPTEPAPQFVAEPTTSEPPANEPLAVEAATVFVEEPVEEVLVETDVAAPHIDEVPEPSAPQMSEPAEMSVETVTAEEPVPVEDQSSELAEPVIKATWPETNVDADPVFWWQVTLHRLGLVGMTRTVFANSEWQGFANGVLSLAISPNYKKIMNDSHKAHLLKIIGEWLPGCNQLHYEFAAVEKTPQLWVDQLVQKANDEAFAYLKKDPFIETLINDFNGQLIQEQAVPNNSPIPSGA